MRPDRALSLLALVTRACPFACVSCATERPGAGTIAREDLRRGIALLLREDGPLEVEYFGGGPLLEYGLVRETAADARRAAERRGKRLTQTVTTSLLPLTPDRARELACLGAGFIVSLDGGLATQSRQRPLAAGGVYPWGVLLRNLDGLLASGAPYFVNVTVRPESAAALADGVAFLLSRGARRFQFAYALGAVWGAQGAAALERAYRSADALCAARGADVLNRRGGPEPVLLDGQLVLDADGTLSVGCWTVLETALPGLRRAFARGSVRTAERLPVEERSPLDQLARLKAAAATPAERRLVADNLDLGRRMERFWAREGARA
ncbi:MAG: hypothetical protein HY079_09750 [Elusimicrobia bacterium]|nr:hypothetical protein [Elusimicrobiota bacterium]